MNRKVILSVVASIIVLLVGIPFLCMEKTDIHSHSTSIVNGYFNRFVVLFTGKVGDC